jgi:DNA polymerase-1
MEINREFKKRGIAGWVCAQIHDQIVCEVPKENAEEAAKIVQDKMENTTKLSIALKAPPMIAHNLRDGH